MMLMPSSGTLTIIMQRMRVPSFGKLSGFYIPSFSRPSFWGLDRKNCYLMVYFFRYVFFKPSTLNLGYRPHPITVCNKGNSKGSLYIYMLKLISSCSGWGGSTQPKHCMGRCFRRGPPSTDDLPELRLDI